MLGMSTTHTQIYEPAFLGISTPDTSIPETLKQSNAPACRKRKHADVQEEDGRVGPPFTIQVLRAALHPLGIASLINYDRKILHFHLPNPKSSYQGY